MHPRVFPGTRVTEACDNRCTVEPKLQAASQHFQFARIFLDKAWPTKPPSYSFLHCAMVTRYCTSCSCCLNQDCYSKSQWSKGDGASRCLSCTNGSVSQNNATETGRCNNATRATFDDHALSNPFASGAFRWVAQGTYTEGERAGESCVCKWFKTGGVMEEHYYVTDLLASKEALHLITKWNNKNLINRMVKLNLPEVWKFTRDSNASWSGKKVLQEPFIEKYEKFNSNSGWADDSLPWPRVMQAISHFSYHISNGQTLLCDLQGGVYSNGVVLTDPVVMSTTGAYGPTDLGSNGISTFFAYHVCNEYCRSEWRIPHNKTAYYHRMASTTMEHVPTRKSRMPMSMNY